ncbi:MAG: hypothetical protein ACM3ML_03220 [Micromonosporaceae bacterium]
MSICTDAFVVTAEAMADAYGFPGFEFVTVQHPLASLDVEQIRTLAHAALPELLRVLGLER